MKKIFVLLIVGLLLSSFSSATDNGYNFVGKWIGTDEEGITGGFIFDSEGYVKIIKGDEEMGGKDFTIDGIKGSMKYSINQKVKPIELDVIMEVNGERKTAAFIIEIVDKDNIVVAGDMNAIRPKNSTADNSITLTRQ